MLVNRSQAVLVLEKFDAGQSLLEDFNFMDKLEKFWSNI